MKKLFTAAILSVATSAAYAVPVSLFDTNINTGATVFNNTITGVGGTVNSTTLSGLGTASFWNLGDFTIANNDGGSSNIYSAATDSSSGQMIGINPAGSGTNPLGYKASGITFTFNTAINALGFEVGDWATCCAPSNLYIQFDGGLLQTVGQATSTGVGGTIAIGSLGYDQSVFVSAIDDTNTFTSVSFWGDGVGEFLTAGGTIRYGEVEIGSIPNPLPLPTTLALLGLGLVGVGVSKRKRK